MGVVHREDLANEYFAMVPPPSECFYCGLDVAPPLVLWSGHDATISLHSACARELGAHLVADSREAQLAGSTGYYRLRAAAVLRERLTSAADHLTPR